MYPQFGEKKITQKCAYLSSSCNLQEYKKIVHKTLLHPYLKEHCTVLELFFQIFVFPLKCHMQAVIPFEVLIILIIFVKSQTKVQEFFTVLQNSKECYVIHTKSITHKTCRISLVILVLIVIIDDGNKGVINDLS